MSTPPEVFLDEEIQYFQLEREEKEINGKSFFYEKWVEANSNSGIAFYMTQKPDGTVIYVVEGYGIGTIDSDTFEEIADGAPVQRTEYGSFREARKGLTKLIMNNLREIRGMLASEEQRC